MTILKKSKIKNILGREILDSRGWPTVEIELRTTEGVFFSSSPSGASKGKREAREIRDKNKKRFFGRGVIDQLKKIKEFVLPKILNKDPRDQELIDRILFEINEKNKEPILGTNLTTPISQAICRAGAKARNLFLFQYIAQLFFKKEIKKFSLPKPFFNMINGAQHSGSFLALQEFLISCHHKKFSENLRRGVEYYYLLKDFLRKEKGPLSFNVGDEGGFVPSFSKTKEVLELLLKIIKKKEGGQFLRISLDCAANSFFKNGFYIFEGKKMKSEDLLSFYKEILKKYSLFSFEDPFEENDFEGFKKMKELKGDFFVFGDDLLASQSERIKWAQEKKLCDGLLLKINQVGTLSQAIESARLAKQFNWKIMVSHRSGETCDDFISDFAVGIFSDFIKAGAPSRGERVVKYNRLLKIEEILK
ncbi:MAG: phosphopyruvate hydratase [Minisyncoccales bacterium]